MLADSSVVEVLSFSISVAEIFKPTTTTTAAAAAFSFCFTDQSGFPNSHKVPLVLHLGLLKQDFYRPDALPVT